MPLAGLRPARRPAKYGKLPCTMKEPLTAIGGLLLPGDENWQFTVQDGVITARRRNSPGVLRIRSIEQNTLPQPLDHEACLVATRWLLNLPDVEPTDRQMLQSICGPYGSFRLPAGPDLLRVWYLRRPAGLIVGVYSCPAAVANQQAAAFMAGQAAYIMTRAMFDRPSWGADEPLTQMIQESFERLENQTQPNITDDQGSAATA